MYQSTMLTDEEITHQQELLKTYRRNLALYLQRQAMMGAAYVTPEVMHGIAEAREQIARIKRILGESGVEVPDHPDDGSAATAAPRAAAPPRQRAGAPATIDRVALRQVLAERFSDEELRDLAFDLGIDYEDLPGATRSGKARELITYTERRGRLDDLVAAVGRLRPGALPPTGAG